MCRTRPPLDLGRRRGVFCFRSDANAVAAPRRETHARTRTRVDAHWFGMRDENITTGETFAESRRGGVTYQRQQDVRGTATTGGEQWWTISERIIAAAAAQQRKQWGKSESESKSSQCRRLSAATASPTTGRIGQCPASATTAAKWRRWGRRWKQRKQHPWSFKYLPTASSSSSFLK